MLITIDGPAGSGKSTVAKMLANQLKCPIIYSGLYYRAIAVYLNSTNWPQDTSVLNSITRVVINTDDTVMVNDLEVSSSLRHSDIDWLSSQISQQPQVREVVNRLIREQAKKHPDLVAEGRDMGSVVFPEAELKVYLDATLAERARRRFLELNGPEDCKYQKILAQIEARDKEDSNRKISPLVIPPEALYIDTTFLPAAQVVEIIIKEIERIKVL